MNRFLVLPVTLAALAFCSAASAQFYLGAQLGATRGEIDNCSAGASCDETDTAFKLFGGYMLTPEWALEVGYTDLGEVSEKSSAKSTEIESTSLGFGVAYHVPFSTEWKGVARFGIASNKGELTSSNPTENRSERKTKPYLGLGVGYALSKELTLTGAWDWTEVEIDSNNKSKFNTFSIGLNYAF